VSFVWPLQSDTDRPQLITGVASSYSVEDFQEADLLVNITQHSLVPRHEVMTSDAKSELLKK
jgi:DNA-directed RNA polymerase I, II, and III subunit RPABC1